MHVRNADKDRPLTDIWPTNYLQIQPASCSHSASSSALSALSALTADPMDACWKDWYVRNSTSCASPSRVRRMVIVRRFVSVRARIPCSFRSRLIVSTVPGRLSPCSWANRQATACAASGKRNIASPCTHPIRSPRLSFSRGSAAGRARAVLPAPQRSYR